MSQPEISGHVMREFEKIVQSHTESHQQEKWLATACLVVLGLISYSEIDSFPFVALKWTHPSRQFFS